MSNFVNLLKNLLSGVFSFFGGLFTSKKAQGAIEGAAPKPRKARNSGYFLELDDAKGVGNVVTAPSKADVTAELKQPKQSKAKAAPKEPKAAPAVASNAALNLPQPTVTTFAPKYLAPNGNSNGRRRPGANMSSFLEMARQVKTSA